MTHSYFRYLSVMLAALLFAACEKPIDDMDVPNKTDTEDGVRVFFGINNVELAAFDDVAANARKAVGVEEVSSRISLAVFDADSKVKTVNQSSGTDDFGKISVVLQPGNYKVVVIAHNGAGAATINSPQEIKFKDNKVTDTFYYYDDLSVDGNASYDIVLKRAVAMFRLVVKDNIPENVSMMRFYYTGGSSTFNAVTGDGCVNSRQTELREIQKVAYGSDSQYDIYTFPHADGRTLDIKVSALDKTDGIVCEREFNDIPVEKNKITQYSGLFFGESPGGGRSFSFSVEDEWTYDNYEY